MNVLKLNTVHKNNSDSETDIRNENMNDKPANMNNKTVSENISDFSGTEQKILQLPILDILLKTQYKLSC